MAPQLDILIEGFQWSLSAVLLGAFLGIVVPALAAVIPVYNGVRVRIIDAFTDLGIGSDHGADGVTRALGRLGLPYTIKQSLINVYQKRRRLALTGATLMMTAAAFMATIALTVVMNQELTAAFDRLFYHFDLTTNELVEQDRLEEILLPLEEVDSLAPAAFFWIQVEADYFNFFTRNNLLQVFGLDPDSGIIEYDYVDGDGWRDDPERDGMMISAAIANQTGLEAGDLLSFSVGGRRYTREIIGIDRNGFDFAWLRWDDLAQMAGSVEGAPRPNEYFVLGALQESAAPIIAIGLDEALITFFAESPENEAEDPGVYLSTAFAEGLADAERFDTGDTLELTLAGEDVGRRIDGIVPAAILAQAARDQLGVESLPPNLVIFGFNDLVALTGVSLDGAPVPNGYYVTLVEPDPSSERVDDVIDIVNGAMLEEGLGARSRNLVEQSELLTELVNTNTSIIGSATLLIGAVGAIGLLTTLSIAVLERQKEIGVMRSIGASSGVIATQFLAEGVIIGFVSWVASIPVSFLLARQLFAALQLENVPFSFPPIALLIGLVGILLISAVASVGPALSAARKTVSDILRYQ